MEVKYSPKSLKQWYERVVRLDRNCRKSRREKERNGERSRKKVKITRKIGEIKIDKQRKSSVEKKVFWIWRIWIYCEEL